MITAWLGQFNELLACGALDRALDGDLAPFGKHGKTAKREDFAIWGPRMQDSPDPWVVSFHAIAWNERPIIEAAQPETHQFHTAV